MTIRQRGQLMVWFAVMLPMVFLPILGLMIDAGFVFNARRDLQEIADGAARTGGMEIDVARVQGLDPKQGEDGKVRLDPQKAHDAAAQYLVDAGNPPGQINDDIDVDKDGRWIVVTARRDVKPTFLSLLHAPTIHMQAQGEAQPCAGVTESDAQCT